MGRPSMDHYCSECGRRVPVSYNLDDYQYQDSQRGFQCSYTCNDHAQLRHERYKVIDWEGKVKKCEDMMRAQGKTVLDPIDLSAFD